MDNQLKKLTAEIKAAFIAALGKKEFAEVVAETKASDSHGTFEVIISTADRDRQGDVVLQDGWDLVNYKANPVVLWAHDYSQLPIGVCDAIEVKDGKLVAKGRFAAHEFAQSVRALYDAGMLKATSVGFIPTEFDGDTIIKAELLEFSFVPVPANPMALSLAAEKQLDVVKMFVKGLFTKDVETPTDEPAAEEQPTADTTDTEPAPASEPSADETATTAPPVEPIDGAIAEDWDDATVTPEPTAEPVAEGNEGASEVEPVIEKAAEDEPAPTDEPTEPAADDENDDEPTDNMAAYEQLKTALQAVHDAASREDITVEDLKAACLTSTEAMLAVVDQLMATETADKAKGITQKAGRTLSKKTRALLENTLAELKTCVAAVGELLKNADAEGGEGKATGGEPDAQNEPTEPQGFAEVKAALKQFSDNREVMRMVATSVSSALERINKNAKANR